MKYKKQAGKIVVKWSRGMMSFWNIGNALEYANDIKRKYHEEPFIYDEY